MGFIFADIICCIAFSISNGISAGFLCGNLLVDFFMSLAGFGVFFPSFLCAFHWCSFIAFSLFWTLHAFPLLFHLVVLAPVLLPSLFRRKEAGFHFPDEGIILSPGKTLKN